MASTRPCVLMNNLCDENPEWGIRPEYAEQFREYFDIIWSRDVEKNPELGKKVVAAIFNRGNDFGLLDKLDSVFPNIKIITSISVGVERVDVIAYNKRGIKFCNSPGILDPVVAEFAIGLMLASARNIIKGYKYAHSQEVSDNYCYEQNWVGGVPVSEATVGIIGLGRIGYSIAQKAYRGFNMKILYYDKFRRSEDDEKAVSATYYTDLHQMLKESDFVVTICPVTPETTGILGAAEFKVMKKSAIVINVGRGKLIKTDDLAKALQSGEILGAALDVTDPEPLPRDHTLLTLPQVIVTPHIAGALLARRSQMARLCAENIKACLEGKPLLSEFKPI
ncbi:probable 2-ketogluconate reductase [Liolophura sinensis]|uniref:probable 2-ketogluconate reductase n=1 Tax=Liolophura sinensis TaxID=3198878 RepID=UPI003157FCE9